MSLKIIQLKDLIETRTSEDLATLLHSFHALVVKNQSQVHDVETFLHKKAVEFEKLDLARTYLVLSTYKNKPFLAGYFSISNKPLTIPRKTFQRFSTSLKKRLMGVGHKTDQQSYEIRGYLLGQLGKNYNEETIQSEMISGADLLTLACEKIEEAQRLVGGRIIYIECDDHPKLIEFYQQHGFRLLEDHHTANQQVIMVRRFER